MKLRAFKKVFTKPDALKKKRVGNILFLSFLFCFTALIIFFLTSYELFANSVNDATVIINDSGFQTTSLSVQEGTKVTWVVEGNNKHWPASDPHPTHGEYPEKGGCIASLLDACKELKQGETYSFVFKRPGLWSIHDHLHPGSMMMIEVTASKEMGILSVPDSSKFRNSPAIKQQQIIVDLAKNNPQKAWDYLKKTYIIDNEVIGNPHSLAHLVGNNAYTKFGLDGVRICDSKFAYGCYHGVTEQMLLHLGITGINKIEQSCINYWPPNESENFTGCIHGAGHGLVTWREYDLKKAIADCDGFTQYLRNYCYNGAMMEFMEGAPRESFDEDNPWALCNSLESESQQLCARIMIISFTTKFNWDFAQIAGNCSKAPSEVFRSECFMSLGDHAAQSANGDIFKIKAYCDQITDPDGKGKCYSSAATQVIFQEYKNWAAVSEELCREEDVDHDECEEGLKNTILTNNKRS